MTLVALLSATREAAAQKAARIDSISPASARVGDEVTITGNGFGAINVRITVGGVAAQIVAANGHAVTFRVPEGLQAGATLVTATNPGGHKGQLSFTVLPPLITVSLDTAAAETALVPRGGGTVTTLGRNGISYALTIPADALIDDTEITITPVTGISNFHLPGGVLAAVHLEPEGLQFLQAATLTLTLPGPPAPALVGRGLIGFSMQNDGSGFESIPFGVDGSLLTLPVHHFTTAGVGSGVCSPKIVTSAFGIDACREMSEALARLAVALQDGNPNELTQDERDKMAAHIVIHLDRWLFQFVAPSFADAADPAATAPDVDHVFDVALREFLEIRAIIELAEGLGVKPLMAAPMAQAERIIPDALRGRQRSANTRCLAERPLYLTHVRRVLTLANQLDLFGIPVDSETRGVTCVDLVLKVVYPEIVPAGGAEVTATADLTFSDGAGLPGPVGPVVRVTLVPGFAEAGPRLETEGEFFAILATTVGPRLDEPNLVTFRVNALSPQLGQRRTQLIERCRISTSNLTSSQGDAARASDAGTFQPASVMVEDGPVCEEEAITVLSTSLDIASSGGSRHYEDAAPDIAPFAVVETISIVHSQAYRGITTSPNDVTLSVGASVRPSDSDNGSSGSVTASIVFRIAIPMLYTVVGEAECLPLRSGGTANGSVVLTGGVGLSCSLGSPSQRILEPGQSGILQPGTYSLQARVSRSIGFDDFHHQVNGEMTVNLRPVP
jgi:hypothetical protein